jgi:moderate conductance mechanosensitive channel
MTPAPPFLPSVLPASVSAQVDDAVEQVGSAIDEYWAGPAGDWTRVAIVVVIALLVRVVSHFVIRTAVRRIVHHHDRRVEQVGEDLPSPIAAARTVQRAKTLGSVLSNVVSVLLTILVLLVAITVLLPNASGAFALITAALGAGLGFGAQNIIKDVLNGLFMVIEDQLGVGDIVDTGFATGVVEGVGIRVTQVRDVAGTLWFVRNGEILRVGNKSMGWARVIVDLPVPYDSDIDTVKERLLETAVAMSDDPDWKQAVLETPSVWGVESVAAEAIVLRLVIKTRPGQKDDFAREIRRRLKAALDDIGVHVPSVVTTAVVTPQK